MPDKFLIGKPGTRALIETYQQAVSRGIEVREEDLRPFRSGWEKELAREREAREAATRACEAATAEYWRMVSEREDRQCAERQEQLARDERAAQRRKRWEPIRIAVLVVFWAAVAVYWVRLWRWLLF